MRDRKHRIHRMMRGTMLVAAIMAFTASSAFAAIPREMTDANITRAIESEFILEEGVPYSAIDTTTRDGIVTLAGTVDSLLAQERAELIAENVRGVRGVVNLIRVVPPRRPDPEIVRDVKDALFRNPATELYEIDVASQDGTLTLSGTVESWQEKKLAETVARKVKGVSGVENAIEVAYPTTRADSEIRADIEQRLRWDLRLSDDLIDVKVTDGSVQLSGIVGSAAERRSAESKAWVAGVRGVDGENLKVREWARDMDYRPTKYVWRSDKDIARAVRDAFVHDPRVFSLQPDVTVHDGTVVLSGVVDTLAEKAAAEQTALNTVGVWRVKNHLKVRPDMIADDELKKSARKALESDAVLGDTPQLIILARNGRITIQGTVDSHYDKFRATDLVASLKGVRAVDNRLTVDGERVVYRGAWFMPDYHDLWNDPVIRDTDLRPRSDWEIRQDIESELYWSPFVDADQVDISVEDRVATLKGTVDTWAEHGAAIENAYEGGASRVIDKLKVRHGPSYYRP